MKDAINIIGVVLLAIAVGILTTMFAPSAWCVSKLKDDFGLPIKTVAMVKDTLGVSLTHIEHIDDKCSYFICDIIEPTGSIGDAEVKLRGGNGLQYNTQWVFLKYDPRTKTDHYEISGDNYQKLKALILTNDMIMVSLKDSNGSNIVKTIQCKGFEKMCNKARER